MTRSAVRLCAVAAGLLLASVAARTQAGPSPVFAPLAEIRSLLAELAPASPADLPRLIGPGAEQRWMAWISARDQAIRQRLRDGDKDTLVNWLLLGRSFSTLPPVRLDSDADGSAVQAATVLIRARTDALIGALGTPGNDERRRFALSLLRGQGLSVGTSSEQARVRDYLLRGVQSMFQGATPETATTPTSEFERRGLSLDTAIAPGFALEQSLRALSARGVLAEGSVRRVAIIGAGLDFADKDTGFDFYPVQTLQPFAVLDTLRRLRLTPSGPIDVVALDISSRVLDHITTARANTGDYLLHLPLARSEPWSPALRRYWSALGDQLGTPAPSTAPADVEMRAIRIPRAIVETVSAEDVNVIVARSESAPFDLIVATNVLLYYGPFDQALALSNVEAMLADGGVFLTNTSLPTIARSGLSRIGSQVTLYTTDRRGDEISWYRRSARP